MKAESTIMPIAPYEIEYKGELAKVTFYGNVIKKENKGDTDESIEADIWEYDYYTLSIRNRANLINILDYNLESWIQTAKDIEYTELANKIREKRDALLLECDWTQTIDTPLSEEEKEMWRQYRQALRDVPQQPNFPYDLNWMDKCKEFLR